MVDRAAALLLWAASVETRVRPGAEVLIAVQANAHPVLSSWHYGFGRVTAFMTEPVGEGTQRWQGWHEYGRMLARIVSRTADDSQVSHVRRVTRDNDVVRVTAQRSSAASDVSPKPFVVDAGGTRKQILAFNRFAPGVFVS